MKGPLQRALTGLSAARSVADYRRETQQVLDALDSSSSGSAGDGVYSVSLLVSVQQVAAAAALQQLLRCLPSMQQQQRKSPVGLSARDSLLLLSVISRADSCLGVLLQTGVADEEDINDAAKHLEGAVEAVLLLLQHVSNNSRTRLLLDQQQNQQQCTATKGIQAAAAVAEWEKSCSRVLQLLLHHSKLVDRLPQTRKGMSC